MPGFLKRVAGLLLYREPKNEERGFELLEGEEEGIEDTQQQDEAQPQNRQQQNKAQQHPGFNRKRYSLRRDTVKQQTGNTRNKGIKAGKPPMTVGVWNVRRKAENAEKHEDPSQPQTNTDDISMELCESLATIQQKFHMPQNQDLVIREFKIGRKVKAFMVYLQGMTDKNTIDLAILPKLMSKDVFEELGEEYAVDYLIENILPVHNVKKSNKYSNAVMQVLSGVSAIFVEGCSDCILIETRGFEKRSVDQPVTETVVKGSQEGFTENLRTNVTLVRRIIKNENLITETLPVGNTNHSTCAVMYLEGVANPRVVQEVKKRLRRINTDFIEGDGMIMQFIEDDSLMLFPQMLDTERPDRAASFLMEGQVVIISEGTPFALVVPVTFFRLFHTSEDSFVRWPAGNFLRFIRLFGLFCATFLPGLYVALTLYHVEMVPTELLLSIAQAKEMVPFPTILEVLLMEVSFELIREGGIRVPSVIGQTLGIVGALILGEAAVAAGLVSPLLVIVVSVTGLGSFAIPNYSLALAIRIERFLFIFAGAVLGFYGIALMAVLLAYCVCSMKSFGVPFFAPVAPKTRASHDVITKYPIWMQKNRSDGLNTPNRRREGTNVKRWIDENKKDSNNEGDQS